jgi:predicted transposase YbfD/YdcC
LSKKTIDSIVKSGNDYLIQVKGNQPKLLKSLEAVIKNQNPISHHCTKERSRGRYEKRRIKVFKAKELSFNEWINLNRIIHVERVFYRKGKIETACSYYISSLCSNNAKEFASGIRGHWSIENRLHWVKDVIQNEDKSGIKSGNGVEILSLLKNIAINICRERGFDSVKSAGIYFASNVKKLCHYFRT